MDVFSKQSNSEKTDYWELLGNLREIKNRIFFESIQDETAELFK
ncbi:MAG: hypothetical protein GY808_15850 [Gammaproteobacteria bacterium]|nr:hypothetical protein [Gammaproteobacteria bacterium]